MEWPAKTKRTGGSRREARARLLGSTMALLAVAAGLFLLALGRFAPERMTALRAGAVDANAPLWRAASGPAEAVSGVWETISGYPNAVSRARRLEGELASARASAARADVLAAENARLKHLLGFAEGGRTRVAVARIAGGSGGGLVETAVVSAGAANGVRPGQPVLTDAGLLGRVVEVGGRASRVLLVSDNDSRVPVRVVRTGVSALLAGVGGGMAELRFVVGDPSKGPKIGDLIVTSGEGGLFAPDVPVARVVAVVGDSARAMPIARPDTLGLAVIEAAWLPPPSAAATTPDAKHPVEMAAMVNP